MKTNSVALRVLEINAPVGRRLEELFGKRRKPREVYGLLSEFLLVEGKRLRPALCIASCVAVGGKAKDALCAATAIEMFHNFTLIHDDIEDGSLMRRGRQCMHIKHGLPLALNAGDGLFMMVWREALCIQGSKSVEAQKRLLSAFTQVLEGQAVELGWHRNDQWKISESEYYRMAGGKTGALIAASCEVGALLGGADKRLCRALWRFGMGIGIGFQMIDDALNIGGVEKSYRKEIGGDVREGKRTLLTAWALSHLPRQRARVLEAILHKGKKSSGDVKRAVALIKESGAVGVVMGMAEERVARAMAELSELPESRAKRDLQQMAEYITRRNC